jgi:hypothetical protein
MWQVSQETGLRFPNLADQKIGPFRTAHYHTSFVEK